MTKNTTAVSRGAVLAKVQTTFLKKQAEAKGVIKVDGPNREQRRAYAKQEKTK